MFRLIFFFLQSIAMIESNLLPEDGHCSECKCWGPPKELQPVTMWYRNTAREAMYRAQPDPSFRFDLICSFVLFLSIGLIQVVVFKRSVSQDWAKVQNSKDDKSTFRFFLLPAM